MARFHYEQQDIVNCLKALGVQKGDILYSHVSLLKLGFCKSDPLEALLSALKEVLGKEGTFITPAFSYSFCSDDTYNPRTTDSSIGVFSNHLIKKLNMHRRTLQRKLNKSPL